MAIKSMAKREMKTVRLKKLEAKLSVLDKSRNYLERELQKIRVKEASVRSNISREKKAIALVNRAKRLR